jgi:hypothetical protein
MVCSLTFYAALLVDKKKKGLLKMVDQQIHMIQKEHPNDVKIDSLVLKRDFLTYFKDIPFFGGYAFKVIVNPSVAPNKVCYVKVDHCLITNGHF